MKFKLVEAVWTEYNLNNHFNKHVLDKIDANNPREKHDRIEDLMAEFANNGDSSLFRKYTEDLSNAPCKNLMPNTYLKPDVVYGCMINYKGQKVRALKVRLTPNGRVDAVMYNPYDDGMVSSYRMGVKRLMRRLQKGEDFEWVSILDENKPKPASPTDGEADTEA